MLPEPTLPNITLDDDDLDDSKSNRTRVAPSAYSGSNDYYYGSDNKSNYASDYPPPMPAYTQQYSYGQNYPGYSPSVHTTPDESSVYHADQYDSKVNLAAAPAPIARAPSPMDNPHSATYNNFAQDNYAGYSQDNYNAYTNGNAYAGYGQQAHGYGQYDQNYHADDGYGVYGQGQDRGHTEYASSLTLSGGNSSAAPSRAQNASRAQQRQQDGQPAYQYDSQQHYGQGTGYADNYGRHGGGYAM